jgi:hypothetical protein
MDIREKTIGVLIDELITTDLKCFLAQDDIQDENLSSDKQLEAAHKAQNLNKRRNQLISAIDQALEQENSPSEKTY